MTAPPNKWIALAERVEALTAPCRDTDDVVGWAFCLQLPDLFFETSDGARMFRVAFPDGSFTKWMGCEGAQADRLTASVDAVLELVHTHAPDCKASVGMGVPSVSHPDMAV